MKNILKLHEAIAVILLNCKRRKAAVEFIADQINKRKLYYRKDKQPVPSYQIMMRTKLAKGRYHHLFEYKKPGVVILK